MIKVNAERPDDLSWGSPFDANVLGNKISTIFNFDIPQWWAGKTCSLIFLFPTKDQLQTSNFNWEPTWGVAAFSELAKPATEATTYNNKGPAVHNFGEFNLSPGHSYVISTHKCPAGKRVGMEMAGHSRNGYQFNLSYFQDYNPAPIGLYLRAC